MSLRFAFNTNGAANHRLDDALGLIADAGYDGVALTLDIHHLDPFAPDFAAERRRVAARLRTLDLGCVVETGARFLLDPRAKHEPTLLTPSAEGRARRVEFLRRAIAGGHAPAETVRRLTEAGLRFRNDVVTGPGGSQVLLVDPAGNLVELFQPAAR